MGDHKAEYSCLERVGGHSNVGQNGVVAPRSPFADNQRSDASGSFERKHFVVESDWVHFVDAATANRRGRLVAVVSRSGASSSSKEAARQLVLSRFLRKRRHSGQREEERDSFHNPTLPVARQIARAACLYPSEKTGHSRIENGCDRDANPNTGHSSGLGADPGRSK